MLKLGRYWPWKTVSSHNLNDGFLVSYWLLWYRNKGQQFWFIHKFMQSNIKRNDVYMIAGNIQLNINSSTCWTLNEQLHRKVLLGIFHFWWFHKISVSWVIYELKSKKKLPCTASQRVRSLFKDCKRRPWKPGLGRAKHFDRTFSW